MVVEGLQHILIYEIVVDVSRVVEGLQYGDLYCRLL